MATLSKPKISKDDMRLISKRRHDHQNKKVRQRLNILWFALRCKSARQIADFVGASPRQVFHILEMYKRDGINRVMAIGQYNQPSILDGFTDLIKEEFQKQPPATAKEAKNRIKTLTGITRSVTQITIFMKKIGMKLLKAASIPMGKNEDDLAEKVKKQREFVDNQLDPVLKESEKGTRTVLFMDACHIQLACILGFLWCFARKYVKALPNRGRINIIGACSPYGDEIICDIIQESVNEESIAYFLFKVRNKIKKGKLTLVLDNASYHTTPYVLETAKSLGIDLLFLPVASPNLNIIERLWKFAKKTFVANNIFDSLDNLQKHLKKCFSTLKKRYKNELDSLLTLNFQYFDGTVQFQAA